MRTAKQATRGPRYATPGADDRRIQNEVREAMARMAKTQQQIARAFHVSETRVSQMVRQWPTACAFTEKCLQAARASHTDGLTLLLPAIVEVARASVEGVSDRALARLRIQTLDRWMTTDCDEQRLTILYSAGRADRNAFAWAHLNEAVVSIHLAAIALEEQRRGIAA